MTWFFAVVVVAVMGGVAVVASGRGGSMAETYDDRPDALVRVDGPLAAPDLRRVSFSTAFRGYRMSEVDALLDRLAAELEPRRGPGAGSTALGAGSTALGAGSTASDTGSTSDPDADEDAGSAADPDRDGDR